MNMKFAKTAATIIVALSAMVSAETLTGRDIVQKVHDRPDGDTRSSELSMTLNGRGQGHQADYVLPLPQRREGHGIPDGRLRRHQQG